MSHRFEVVDDPRFQSERLVELPCVDHPRTIRQDASISFHWTGDGEHRLSDVCALAMLLQKRSRRIGKSRKTSNIKAFHWAYLAVRQKRKSCVRRSDITQQDALGRN
jgi:hypothetical protein